MKKIILALAAATLGSTMYMTAQNLTYNYQIEDEFGDLFPPYGSLRRVSPNGQWATGGDEDEQSGSFIINTSDPEKIIMAKYLDEKGEEKSGLLLDIDNNGMGVGAYYEKILYTRYEHAAIFKDGKWICLPEPEGILGRSQAVAISADSKVIAGHAICKNIEPDEPGRYFPVIWTLNDATGEYEMTRIYNNLYLPGTLGFFVYDMTPNAKFLCGIEPLDFSDPIAVVLDIETGELRRFHTIEYKNTYFEEAGGWYSNMYVDGIMNGFDNIEVFGEMLLYATDRYMYGSHSVVSDVKEDGTGVITTYAAVYDIEEDRFIDGAKGDVYLCGVGADILFTRTGKIIKDGTSMQVKKYVATTDPIAGIYSVDDAGRVLTGAYVDTTPMGDQYESPVLVLLDEESELASIKSISVDKRSDAKVKVAGRIVEVEGADTVEIFNINGILVSATANATLLPGTYIVVADGISHKINIK